MMVCVFIENKLTKTLGRGIYLFVTMSRISVGYGLLPLSDSGYTGAFQDMMHVFVVIPLVILLPSCH